MNRFATASLTVVAALSPLVGAPPEVLDDRFELTLFAEHPMVRTPVGLAIDDKGRTLVVESHTHFRPDGYEGPGTDRILALSDTDLDGKADKSEVYFEGGKHTMSIAFDRRSAKCIVATRSNIFTLSDADGDGLADAPEEIVRLETTGDYPHNGLCGLALREGTSKITGWEMIKKSELGAASGDLEDRVRYLHSNPHFYFGLGENLGHPYKLVAKDGTTLSGGGDGGNVYAINGDGTGLQKIATGFWNPFGICEVSGEIFAVDNDPDSRPPNRLLHVVPGGDYGYQFRYGRPGTHPLQAWDGELPGTLPMVCGVGEAACSVIPYEGSLWVTSWGHHRIESYTLEPRGASYGATMKTIVRGDENFRPVGIDVGIGGVVFFSDWVDKSYPLHGKGRVWKLALKAGVSQGEPLELNTLQGEATLVADDPFLRALATHQRIESEEAFNPDWEHAGVDEKIAILAVTRGKGYGDPTATLRTALTDPSPEVGLAAVRWVSDEKITEVADEVHALALRAIDQPRLFDAAITTLKRLGTDTRGFDREAILLAVAGDIYAPPPERVAALRRIDPASKKLPIETYRKLIEDPDPRVAYAAVWHLTQRDRKDARPLLQEIANDEDADRDARADARMALSDEIEFEAQPTRPLETWLEEIAAAPGDVLAGRRVFFASNGGLCSRCHVHGGYGRGVGPDLPGSGERESITKLVESMIAPSKEIPPMFVGKMIEKQDGELVVGLETETTGRHGTGALTLTGVDGTPFEVPLSEIRSYRSWPASLMPTGLDARLSVQDMRDLIAFLKTDP